MKKQVFALAFFVASVATIFANGYPSVVYPENYAYDAQVLSDGSKVTVTPQWIQNADVIGGKEDLPYFAVSGEFFYLYRKSDGKLLQFDRVHGLFVKEIDIEQTDLVNKDNIGFFGADEAQNLYLSTRFESTADFKIDDKKTKYVDALNLNVIGADGKIIKSLKSPLMPIVIGKKTVKESYGFLNVRGDITKNNSFFVTLPIIFLVPQSENSNGAQIQIYYKFFQQSSDGMLIDLGGDGVLYKNFGMPEHGEVVYDKYSFYPINWIKDKCIKNYYWKSGDANSEYFYALTRTANKNYQEISNFYDSNGADNKAKLDESLGFTGTYLPGGIACKYGDTDLIIDANIDNAGKLHFNVREISFQKSNYATPDKSKLLWSFPKDSKFELNANDYYENVSIQAIESNVDGNPRVDIYMYAPGKIMAYYTLSNEKVNTGYFSPLEDTESTMEYENGVIRVKAQTEVELYDITGRLQARYDNHNGTIDLSSIPSGIYIAKTEGAAIKIMK